MNWPNFVVCIMCLLVGWLVEWLVLAYLDIIIFLRDDGVIKAYPHDSRRIVNRQLL